MRSQCEGWRRRGGAFTLGPVEWKQCANDVVVVLMVLQDGETQSVPACTECWHEAIERDIPISKAVPLNDEVAQHG